MSKEIYRQTQHHQMTLCNPWIILRPKFIVLALITIMLAACTSNLSGPQPTHTLPLYSATITLSATPTLLPSKTPTARPTRPPKPTPIPTETIVIPAYPTKEVVLEYTQFGGGLGSPDTLLYPLFGGFREGLHFVLYSDNQFILQDYNKPIRTKILTGSERDRLFSELDKKDFYSIDTNQTSDETNPIYDFKGRYNEVGVTDGASRCLFTSTPTPKKVCIYLPYREFLVPPVKDLFEFMDRYIPESLNIYQPDRLLLFVSKGRSFYDSYEFFLTPSISSVSWPDDLPSLKTVSEKYLYLEGENGRKVLSLIKNSSTLMVFDENGEEYSIFAEIVLPHETLIQP